MKILIQKGKILKNNNNELINKSKEQPFVTDLRKKSVTNEQDTEDINDIKNIVIVPGQLIQYENPQSDSTPHPSGDMYTKTVPWSDYT